MKNFQLLSVLLLLSSSHSLCVGIRFNSDGTRMYAADPTYPRTQEDVRKAFEELDKKLVFILTDNAKSRESFLLALDAEVKEGPIATHMNNALKDYSENGNFDKSKKEAYEALELAKKAAHDRCNKEAEDALAADGLDSYKKQIRIAHAQRARDIACNAHALETDAYIKALVTISDRLDAAVTPLCTTYRSIYSISGLGPRDLEDAERELRTKHKEFYVFQRCNRIEQRRWSRN